jgi:hypothetical protein
MSSPETIRCRFKMTMPEDPEQRALVQSEAHNYAEAVVYVASFLENRALMGDVDTAFLFHEFKMNVCRHMRGDFDVFGEQ